MKKAIALSFMLAVLLAFSAGGVNGREVTCYVKYDMSIVGPPKEDCNPDTCKRQCESQYYWKLQAATCLDLKFCECASVDGIGLNIVTPISN